tara:strand:- start:171 stop:1886 length:1716 start_codon:yes stop_codon:yes gene_type:complete
MALTKAHNRMIAGAPVNVQDYGAVGDGIANDGPACQLALDSSLNVFFPAGTYMHTLGAVGLVPQSGTRVTMDEGAEIKLGADGSGFVISGSNIELVNVTVNGVSATYTSASYAGIYIDWRTTAGANVTLQGCKVYNHAGGGIIALASSGQASSGLKIRDCSITSTGTHGIIAQDYISDVEIVSNDVKYTGLNYDDRPGITASRYGSNVIVSNNIVTGSASALGVGVHGISIDGTTNATCHGNVVSGWLGYGIEIGGVTNGSFVNNTVISNAKASIALSGLNGVLRNTNVSVIGNSCYTNGDSGILAFITSGVEAYMHQNITISGNMITGTSTSIGIYTTLVDGLNLSNNVVSDCFWSGMQAQDCKNVMITGNVITGNNVTLAKNASIALSGSTATVTSTSHGYSNGDVITIFGANPVEYNGAFTISGVTTNTFAYTTTAGILTPPVGTIQCTASNSASHGGVKVVYSIITTKQICVFGQNIIERNGFRDVYDISLNGCTGFINNILYLKEAKQPRPENLTSGEAPNIRDRIGLFMKNDKVTFSYNNAGTVNYLTGLADGSTTTWTNNSSIP